MHGKGRRVTLKDIARQTGYAVNTVSKALRDAPDLAQETKQGIRRVADDMGYIANLSANSLRSGLTRTLALIVADITNPLFAIVAKEIEAEARSADYTVLVMNTDEDAGNEVKAVRAAIGKGVDGVMLFQTQQTLESAALLERAGVPYALIYRVYDGQQSDAVLVDEEMGGYLAGRRLVERGRRQIAMLAAPTYISSSRLRMDGFLRAMNEAGMARGCRVARLDSALGNCCLVVRALFAADNPPDGIFCFSDIMAFETACVLASMGRRVPEDVSLIGFDNIQSKLAIPFQLTTIAVHKSALARTVMALILKRISGDRTGFPERTVIPVHLVERASV